MRLDARRGDNDWTVYHATRCEVLQGVVWVDDCTMQWCQHEFPLRVVGDDVASRVYDAERIVIDGGRRLVLIDPVADEDDNEVDVLVAAPVPTGMVA